MKNMKPCSTLKTCYRSSRSEVFCKKKKVFLEISKNTQESTIESLFKKVAGLRHIMLLKRDSNTDVSSEFCENYKNIIFTDHLQTTPSDAKEESKTNVCQKFLNTCLGKFTLEKMKEMLFIDQFFLRLTGDHKSYLHERFNFLNFSSTGR